jgi:hypothetical protein
MALTLDERVEIVLLSGRQGWTQRQVAYEFNARHPERNPITQSAVGNLVKKFKETRSVVDKPRVGRPSVGEDIRTRVIAKFHAHSHWFQTFQTPFTMNEGTNTVMRPDATVATKSRNSDSSHVVHTRYHLLLTHINHIFSERLHIDLAVLFFCQSPFIILIMRNRILRYLKQLKDM